MSVSDPVLFVRERDNPADPNAVAIRTLAGEKAGARSDLSPPPRGARALTVMSSSR